MISKKYIDELSYKIIGAAIEVHRVLGPGLLESVYEECMVMELESMGLKVSRQTPVPIFYKGKKVSLTLKLDLLVEGLVVVELKAADVMIPVFSAQIISYLQLSQKPKGLLINFHVINITKTVKAFVSEYYALLPES